MAKRPARSRPFGVVSLCVLLAVHVVQQPADASSNHARSIRQVEVRASGQPATPSTPLPAVCEMPRERFPDLFAALEADVAPERAGDARSFVAARGTTVTQAKAWGDFAVGAMLVGDFPTAAWAGLTALTHAWEPLHVMNGGVLLMRVDKTRDGLGFLDCAYAMDNRSPYLFEALAVAHERLGDHGEAVDWISRAKQSAPGDVVIQAEAQLLTTGQLPQPPSVTMNSTDRCIAELEIHRDDVRTALGKIRDNMRTLKSQFLFVYESFLDADVATAALQEAYGARDLARSVTPSARPQLEAQALSSCVQVYFQLTQQLLRAALESGAPLPFWADVVDVLPIAFAEEQRANGLYVNPSTSTEDNYDVQPQPDDTATTLKGLTQEAWIAYHDTKTEADVAMWEELGFWFGSGGAPAEDVRAAERRWCSRVKPAYEAWSRDMQYRYTRAANRFDHHASRLLWWAAQQVYDARRFAGRYAGKLNPVDLEALDPEQMMSMSPDDLAGLAEGMRYGMLLGYLQRDGGVMSIWSVPTFLDEQVDWFLEARSREEERATNEIETIRERCTPTTLRELLEELTTEELEALLEEINRQMLEDDVSTDTQFRPHCKFTIGGFSASVDPTGKITRGFGGISGSTRGSVFTGATVKAGVGNTVGAYGGVATGDINVIAQYDAATGQWDAVLEAGGSLGVGIAVPTVGEAACYPGEATAQLNAREFLRHDILYNHARNVLESRR